MKNKLLWAFFLLAQSAQAEGTVRNGGNAVVCYDSTEKAEIRSVELFDYWEMSRFYQGKWTISPKSTIEKNITAVVSKINHLDPMRAELYETTALAILANINQYLYNQELPVIDDDHPRVLPSAPCYKEQFAIQVRNPSNGERRFQISRRLWEDKHTTNLARAGIILHEVIYREFILLGQLNSDSTRDFHFLIASNAPVAESVRTYKDLMARLGLSFARGFDVVDVDFRGAIVSIPILDAGGWYKVLRSVEAKGRGAILNLVQGSAVRFFKLEKNSKIRKIRLIANLSPVHSEYTQKSPSTIQYRDQTGSYTLGCEEGDLNTLYESGQARSGCLSNHKVHSVKEVDGSRLQCLPGAVLFHPSGVIAGCKYVKPKKVQVAGNSVSAVAGLYDENGIPAHLIVSDSSATFNYCSSTIAIQKIPGAKYMAFGVGVDGGYLQRSRIIVDFTEDDISERVEQGFVRDSGFLSEIGTELKDPVTFSVDHTNYQISKLESEGVVRKDDFTQSYLNDYTSEGCDLRAQFSFRSKYFNGLEMGYRNFEQELHHEKTEPDFGGESYCKKRGFEGGNRGTEMNTVQVNELFKKIYNLDTHQEEDVPFGESYIQRSEACWVEVTRKY